ncbi:hypothetical protein, partial [Pseudomonas syringae group genomosp. 7]|uniref:hypothetical protein n=1 Tax=Pseudomonas syringae group genomosp. 7 TaxID=251699 RepID=UPI00376FE456
CWFVFLVLGFLLFVLFLFWCCGCLVFFWVCGGGWWCFVCVGCLWCCSCGSGFFFFSVWSFYLF